MDKKLRITLLLIIDSVFAVLELVVGYAVHSLALVADSFHMFNDILSLVVALWAVRVASSGPTATFSYGLQRAEVLGALVNAVFLLALCVTIFLEAIQRFVEPQRITNPVLILVVGVLGLLSNLVGLVLFNEHGHTHGFSHSHSQPGQLEAGLSHNHDLGNVHGQTSTYSDARARQENQSLSSLMPEYAVAQAEHRLLAQHSNGYGSTDNTSAEGAHRLSEGHIEHHHMRPRQDGLKQSQNSMNMEGVFLHVLGDALGNIGVIATALFIWKTDYSWRFYFDPIVSLFITAIIFSTAVPLCMRASKVLLQATPSFVNCQEVAEDIQSIPGVAEIHDLHIWQLSETQVIGTLHVTLSGPPSDFQELYKTIQECFAGHGVPSITIQPEFVGNTTGLRQCESHGNLLTASSEREA